MSDFTDENAELQKGDPLYLGIIGSRQDIDHIKVHELIINPILQELGRVPDKLILPAEGTSTIFLSDWAEMLKIPSQIYEADWRKHQRRAKIFRDARIQQESTHFIVFLNKRSEFNEKLANRLARQGKPVFTVSYNDWSIEMLCTGTTTKNQSSMFQFITEEHPS
jgi:Zn-dependent M32 family carboxypeptidase